MPKKGEHVPEEMKKRIAARLSIVNKGKKPSQATIEAARIANSKPKSELHKQHMREANIGKKQSPETIAKRVAKNTGQKRTPEQRKRMSEAQQKLSQSRDKTFTEEHKKHLSESHKGKPCSEKAKIINSMRWKGPNNPNWNGGTSFLPYCPKFTRRFREQVRKYFNYTCVECGAIQKDEKLHVHHVHYNKQTCCDNTPPMFVALCHPCHTKTNFNREYWRKHFIEVLTTIYNGKGY